MLKKHLVIVRDKLLSLKADGLMLQNSIDVSWLLQINMQIEFCLIFISKDRMFCFVDARDLSYFKKNIKGLEIIPFQNIKQVKHYVNKMHIKRLVISINTTINELNNYIKPLKCRQIIEFNYDELRMVKDDHEIEILAKASAIACEAIHFAKKNVRIGMSEKALSELICQKMFSLGATSLSFPPIVAFGSNTSNIHHLPTDRTLNKNEPILLDIGCVYDGYCSDITRTWFFGKPTPLFKKVYKIVLEANKIGINNALNGTKTKKIDQLMRKYISRQFSHYDYPHGSGHGVGLKIHELPRVNKIYDGVLRVNNVISMEPGIYIKNFGIRIEDLLVIQENRPIILTSSCSKDL